MSNISSRSVSEHLSTLAALLEAEALRCRALGAPNAEELSRRATEVRSMAEQLWDADIALPLPGKVRSHARHARRPATQEAANSLEALGLVKGVAALAS